MSDSEPSPARPKILVATLDWGLGHSTRMIPVIKALLDKGAQVILGSSGAALELLRIEFPELESVEFPGYGVSYGSSARSLRWAIFRQVPAILQAIRRERRFMKELQSHQSFDAIISDNRFGLSIPGVYSVFMTHQVFIRFPVWLKVAELLVNFINHRYIRKFDEFWIPDFEGKVNLSGKLSHRRKMPADPTYIGPLSRFEGERDDFDEDRAEYDLLVILSGPEPQRSILEDLLRPQLHECDISVKIIRGLPGDLTREEPRPGYEIVAFEDAQTLKESLKRSRLVLCRAGYSSIMDLALIRKDAILIPTPGQTEQEYLAHRLKKHKVFYSEAQAGFNLWRALEESKGYSIIDISRSESQLGRVIDEFLGKL